MSGSTAADQLRFEHRYAEPLVDAPPVDPLEVEREAREGEALMRPGEPFALHGCVLTPDEAIERGYVVVLDGAVEAIVTRKPRGMLVVETDGIVMPGLIDLHGHPEYNVFAPWEPPRLYANRGQWRRSDEYAAVVRAPWQLLTEPADGAPSLLRELTRYAEARALVGGATAIQGASGVYPDAHESLVRNVDRYIFGERRARSMVDLGRASPDDLARLRGQIDAGEVRAVYVHLAEGTDETSRREFDDLKEAGLLTPATVVIHGTALGDAELGELREAGAKLVWSPQSNLRLYGQTTFAARAVELGVPMALGADWLPSGSPSLLDEARVAREVLRRQAVEPAPALLVRMLTATAAEIAGLGGSLGRVAPGRPADLLVLERVARDPWESVLLADRRSVQLVLIGGDVAYGRLDWVDTLAGPTEREPVIAWGRQMALDLTYSVIASDSDPPRLAAIRAALVERYPDTGPIFA